MIDVLKDELMKKWGDILLNLQEKYGVSDVALKTFLCPLEMLDVNETTNVITLLVPDGIGFKSIIEKKYKHLLELEIKQVIGTCGTIQFVVTKKELDDDQVFVDSSVQTEATAQTTFEISNFIDSPDVREYNRNTHFTPAEQAVLITMSDRKTLEEKKAALQELVDTYSEEDFHVESVWADRLPGQKGFRQIVLDTIERWNRLLEQRNDEENVVYMARVVEKERIWKEDGYELYFSSYAKAYEYIVAEKREYLVDSELKDIELCAFISRIHLNSGRHFDYSRYDFDNELRLIRILPREDEGEYTNLETDFYVHVPLPFKKGDLVKVAGSFRPTHFGVIPSELMDREHDVYLRTGGDAANMIACLDMYDSKYGICSSDDTSVLQLMYVKAEEIAEKEREILKDISACRKGEWDWVELICKYLIKVGYGDR